MKPRDKAENTDLPSFSRAKSQYVCPGKKIRKKHLRLLLAEQESVCYVELTFMQSSSISARREAGISSVTLAIDTLF
jgi:hypothetical protein